MHEYRIQGHRRSTATAAVTSAAHNVGPCFFDCFQVVLLVPHLCVVRNLQARLRREGTPEHPVSIENVLTRHTARVNMAFTSTSVHSLMCRHPGKPVIDRKRRNLNWPDGACPLSKVHSCTLISGHQKRILALMWCHCSFCTCCMHELIAGVPYSNALAVSSPEPGTLKQDHDCIRLTYEDVFSCRACAPVG